MDNWQENITSLDGKIKIKWTFFIRLSKILSLCDKKESNPYIRLLKFINVSKNAFLQILLLKPKSVPQITIIHLKQQLTV